MARRDRVDICAAVVGDLATDARVWREVRTLTSEGYSVSLIGCRYEIDGIQRRLENGATVTEVPLGSRTGSVSHTGRAMTLLRLWREIVATPARVYHIHNIHPGPAGVLAAALRRARVIYDGHELYGNSEPRTASNLVTALPMRLLERFLVRRADATITTNESRARELARRHGRREVVVLANVPDRINEVVPLDPGFPSGVPILLYQGGIYARQRAFHESIRALEFLPELHMVILGFGREDELDRIRNWSAEQKVTDRVHILGPRPFDELVRSAASATLGLVPVKPQHKSDLLGDTNKLHEYLMAGLPVVASDLPEIRRVVTDGEPPVGELFDPASPESIAQAIIRVLSYRYEERCKEARRLAVERHNWQVQQHRLTDIYVRLIGLAHGSRRVTGASVAEDVRS